MRQPDRVGVVRVVVPAAVRTRVRRADAVRYTALPRLGHVPYGRDPGRAHASAHPRRGGCGGCARHVLDERRGTVVGAEAGASGRLADEVGAHGGVGGHDRVADDVAEGGCGARQFQGFCFGFLLLVVALEEDEGDEGDGEDEQGGADGDARYYCWRGTGLGWVGGLGGGCVGSGAGAVVLTWG